MIFTENEAFSGFNEEIKTQILEELNLTSE